ncbi:hypothetical protein [Microvirga sp. Mcv34]|uniref:hypothetical protein n=1 Tax=Microvirga sp. Mcv34 TaxID=2926016 RepID=UPI0021C75113|nr:hypothetical protein [Microvirga sp. Mcv34]
MLKFTGRHVPGNGNGRVQALCSSAVRSTRTERLLSRRSRFIRAIDATIVRSSSDRIVFVSTGSDRFFRSNFIGNLFCSATLQVNVTQLSVAVRLQCGK